MRHQEPPLGVAITREAVWNGSVAAVRGSSPTRALEGYWDANADNEAGAGAARHRINASFQFANHQPLITDHQSPTTDHQPPITSNQQPTAGDDHSPEKLIEQLRQYGEGAEGEREECQADRVNQSVAKERGTDRVRVPTEPALQEQLDGRA